MPSDKYSILYVDEYRDNLELVKILFEDQGFIADTCDDMKNCHSLVEENKYDAIILDNLPAGRMSLDAARKIRKLDENVPIIFYSGETRTSEINRAMETGANAYLRKPNDLDDLLDTVIQFVKKQI